MWRKLWRSLTWDITRLRSKQVIQAARTQTDMTPDTTELEQMHTHLLFVCGNEQKGHRNHDMLDGAKLVSDEVFSVERFEFYNKQRGSEFVPFMFGREPLPHEIIDKHPRLRIRGELYRVIPQFFFDMDKWRQNGAQFTRKHIAVLVPKELNDGSHSVGLKPIKRVWCYCANPDYWNERLDNGYTTSVVRHYINDFHPPVVRHYYEVRKEEEY